MVADMHTRHTTRHPSVTVLHLTLQRKRRESASSSSSVKKVKKPWWAAPAGLQPTTKRLHIFSFFSVFFFFPTYLKLKGGQKGVGRAVAFITVRSENTLLHPRTVVTKATTEWHFIPLRARTGRLRRGWTSHEAQINCKLAERANQDAGTRAGTTA